jgi:hypothetical protein
MSPLFSVHDLAVEMLTHELPLRRIIWMLVGVNMQQYMLVAVARRAMSPTLMVAEIGPLATRAWTYMSARVVNPCVYADHSWLPDSHVEIDPPLM